MLPLKLVRSFVLGVPINNPLLLQSQNNPNPNHPSSSSTSSSSSSSSDYDGDGDNDDDDDSNASKASHAKKPKPRKTKTKTKTKAKTTGTRTRTRTRTPLLLFVPTRELVADTYTLATIARDMGMDLHPTPSLSHIIFTYPSSSSSSSSPFPSPLSSITSTSTSTSSTSSSSSSSSSSVLLSLPNNAVPLPFPSLSSASLSSLRLFVSLSRGLFKLVFFNSETEPTTHDSIPSSSFNWDCCSVSLFSRLSGDRIGTMDGFSRALAGNGWSIFKTRMGSGSSGNGVVYLFRKMEVSRVRFFQEKGNGNRENRIRELRLPHLDFENTPLRILQYIVLMTDDVFYLA